MRVKCPYCGERPVEEFTFLGDSTVKRPDSIEPDTMDEWFDYVYLRDNPKGSFQEYWHHGAGCRSWLIVERNTATHEVHSVRAARDENKAKKRGAKS